jgi:hypothetical protein
MTTKAIETRNGVGMDMAKVMEIALQGNNIEVIERLVALEERKTRQWAKQQFNIALKEVQKLIPDIPRTKKNPQTKSMYAPLEVVNRVVMPIATEHGFAVSFGTTNSPIEDWLRITAELSHEDGHSQDYHIDLPIDNKGMQGSNNKTLVHGVGSSFSYGQRYLLKLIFNISLADEDDDGVAAGKTVELISNKQLEKLSEGLKMCPKEFTQRIHRAYRIDDIAKLPAEKYEEVLGGINAYLDKQAKKEEK